MRRYTLTVLATDGGGEETAGRIRVNVLDVNDNAPLFQKEVYVGSVRENEQTVQSVARIKVSRVRNGPEQQKHEVLEQHVKRQKQLINIGVQAACRTS